MLKVRKRTQWEVLYESRAVITRSRDRRPSHKIDCTGIVEYVF
ncbi:hypothetical protein HanOQP8_Chr02g0045741 [Helianthus annuus]|nr:hypothetical protein HanOQP8_Chr02g0045741 [Helianthus annuus]